jgi:predicted AAA+ superfamily ATPase
MSLFESGESLGKASLGALFNGAKMEPFSADIDLAHLIDVTIRGGWPQTLSLSGGIAGDIAGAVSTAYIDAIVKNELFNADFTKRTPAKLRALLRSLARNNASTVSDTTLSADIDGEKAEERNEQDVIVSRKTAGDYINDLKKIFVIEDIPGWMPNIRSKTRIRMAPKKIFADPSLAIAVLGIGRNGLMKDLNTYGFMFENLCLRDLAVYAECHGGNLFHYRDNSNLEIDAVIEMPDAAWGAFEVKLGEHQVEAAAHTLKRFRDKMVSQGAAPPACLAVVTGGGFGRQREDGVYVIPVNALKA